MSKQEKIYVSQEKKAKQKALQAVEAHGLLAEVRGADGLDGAILKLVKKRFAAMEGKCRHVRATFQTKSDLYEIGLRTYKAQNIFKQPYRSARFYQQVESWIDELTENTPQVSLKASTYRDRAARDKARAKEQVLVTMDEDIGIEAVREAIYEDVAKLGTGVSLEYIEERGGKALIATRRLDPRCCYPDDSATDQEMMKDFIYQEEMPLPTFDQLYRKFVNLDEVKGLTTDTEGKPIYHTRREMEENKAGTSGYIVRVNHYYNEEFGFRVTFANETVIAANTISRIPVTFHYKKKTNDSIWGISAIEETASEVNALDVLIELGFRNAKASLQDVVIADSSAGFSLDLKQQPGGIWLLPSVGMGKSVRDTFERLHMGGIDPNFFSFRELFLDELSISSQHDQRALQVNPNQLATQTVAKKESFARRGRRVSRGMVWRSEKRRTEIRLDLLDQYIVPRQQDFYIEGYYVLQGESSAPKLIRDDAANGVLKLKRENADVTVNVVVTDAKTKAILEEQERDNLIHFMKYVVEAGRIDARVAEKIDFVGLIRAIAEKFQLDKRQVFKDSDEQGRDIIRRDQLRILSEFPAPYPASEDLEELMAQVAAHRQFLGARGTKLSRTSRQFLIEHITRILEKINRIAETESREPADPATAAPMPQNPAFPGQAAPAMPGQAPLAVA